MVDATGPAGNCDGGGGVTGSMTSRRLTLASTLTSLVLALAACSPSTVPSPSPTIIPGPSGGTTLEPPALRLLLIDRFGPLWYCDRDAFPVGRDEQAAALEAWPQMRADEGLLRAIGARLGIDVAGEVADADKLALYRLWKMALAVQLATAGEHDYRFDYLAQPAPGASDGTRTAGRIRDTGEITIEQQAPAGEPICPICLARGTPIDTPNGQVAVERLRLGDPVWTLDAAGRRVAGAVIALGSTAAPPGHRVVRLVLADGRTVTASPGHPLGDGRPLGELDIGDLVDGTLVVGVDRLPYASGSTFDLVVSGATGWYLSSGIALGSTLGLR